MNTTTEFTSIPDRFHTVVMPDDNLRHDLIVKIINDENFPIIDQDALFSILFSYVDDLLAGVMTYDALVKWVIYHFIQITEQDEVANMSAKLEVFRDLIVVFMKNWIKRLQEDNIIEHEHFAYDYAGLLRDGSFVFRRKKNPN